MGMPVEQKLTCEANCEGFDSQATVTGYDKLGRPTEYMDADGNTSRPPMTSTAVRSRRATVRALKPGLRRDLGSADQTRRLRSWHLHREPTTPTAAWSNRACPTGLLPKRPTTRSAHRPNSATRRSPAAPKNAPGSKKAMNARSTVRCSRRRASPQSQQYSYDKAGRLTLAKDTPQGGSCTTRQYVFDADSNRTKLTTRAPGAGGACDTSSDGTSQNYSYDAADRLTDSGIAYDSFGRITSLPADYAGGSTLDDHLLQQRNGRHPVPEPDSRTATSSTPPDARARSPRRVRKKAPKSSTTRWLGLAGLDRTRLGLDPQHRRNRWRTWRRFRQALAKPAFS